jgi:hypothetical protein
LAAVVESRGICSPAGMGRAGLKIQGQGGCLGGVDNRLRLSPHGGAGTGDADQTNHQDYEANALSDDLRIVRPQRT